MILKPKRHAQDFFVRAGLREGNPRAGMVEALERREMMDGTFRAGDNLTFLDSNGSQVTLVLTGPGVGQMFQAENRDIAEIKITDSTLESKLSIRVAGNGPAAVTWVGAIFIGGPDNNVQESIGMIDAPRANINAAIAVQGGINSLVVNRLSSAAVVVAEGVKTGMTIRAGQVTDSSIQVLGPITYMSVGSWNDTDETADFLSCQTLGRFFSRGDMDATLEVTQNAGANRVSVTQIDVLGEVQSGKWQISGNVGTIKVGGGLVGTQCDIAGNVGTLTLGGMSGAKFTADKVGSVLIGKLGMQESAIDLLWAARIEVAGNASASSLSINSEHNGGAMGFKAVESLRFDSDVTEMMVSIAGSVPLIQVKGGVGGTWTIDGDLGTFLAKGTNNLTLTANKATTIRVGIAGMIDTSLDLVSAVNIWVEGDLTGDTINIDKSAASLRARQIFSTQIKAGDDLTQFTAQTFMQSKLMIADRVGQLNVAISSYGSNYSMASLGNGILREVADVSMTVNAAGTARSLGIKAINSLTISLPAPDFNLDCSGAGSDVGTLRINGKLKDSTILISGNVTSATFGGIDKTLLDFEGRVGRLTFTGDVDEFLGQFPDLGEVTFNGHVNRANLTSDGIQSLVVIGDISHSYFYFGTDDPAAKPVKLQTIRIRGQVTDSNITTVQSISVGDIFIGDLSSQSMINVFGDVNRMRIASVSDHSLIRLKKRLTSLITSPGARISGTLEIADLGTLIINGDVLDGSILSSEGIGSVTVTGDMENALVSTQGSIGSITVGALRNTAIYAGYSQDAEVVVGRPTDTSAFVNLDARIGSLVVRTGSLDRAFVNSAIASPILGRLRLSAVDTHNDGNVMGLFALSRIDQVSLRAGPVLKDLSGTGVKRSFNDFRIEILEVAPPAIED